MKQKDHRGFIPALKFSWLTPLFDPVIRASMREFTIKSQLVQQAGIKRHHRVLDLGCGTATLTLLVKQTHPETDVVGFDADPQILIIAQAKAKRAGMDIVLDQGMSFELPYTDCSFDRVLSSLLFHHLTLQNKRRTLKEIYRILRPGGELHIADLGKPDNILMNLISQVMRRLEEASDNIHGLLPEMLGEAGFDQVAEPARYMTLFGTLSLYSARKPTILPGIGRKINNA